MHEQIFISGVWHSGTSLVAEIAKLNGYDLGKATNSKNDNNFAWRGPLNSIGSNSGYFTKDFDNASVKGILEKSWPFDTVNEEENKLFADCILKSRNLTTKPKYNCCKLPGLSLMTPHISKAFPEAPIIHVLRNPVDLSLSKTDNYFLDRLLRDKVSRDLKEWEISSANSVKFLFLALGGLEWTKIRFLPASIDIQANRKKILWNLLYTLRWILIMNRLRVDIESHNIKNHYIIKFENLITGPHQRAEIEKLRNILGVEGDLKMPSLDKTKAYKSESFLPLPDGITSGNKEDIQECLSVMYEMCEPYLEEFEYERVLKFMKNLEFIK